MRRSLALCVMVTAACGGEDVGVVRLAISESKVDASRVVVTAPDMLPVVLDFDPSSETFEGAVSAGESRTFTFFGEHGGLPWYWGETTTDVTAGTVTDVSMDAWPAGRMFVQVSLPTGEGAVGAAVDLVRVAGDADAPALRSGITDATGGIGLWAPAAREGAASPFRWEPSASLGSLASAPLGFAIDLAQGAFVEIPTALVDPAAPARIVLVVGSLVGGVAPEATDLFVRVLDASGSPATDYAGTISFDGSDTALLGVPADYAFDPATDGGEHVFAGGLVALVASGAATLAVRDVDRPALSDERTVDILDAGTVVGDAVSLLLRVKGGLVLGVASDVVVTALDASGRVATGYRGTVTFADSDVAALAVPPDQTFGPLDLGVRTIPAGVLPLLPVGTAILRVHDVDDATLAGALELPIE